MDSCRFKSVLVFILTLLRLSRIDSCLLAFLAVLMPVAYHSESLLTGITRALPILPISMCGFVINDVNDIDKDEINHPKRPLPRKDIRVTTAVIFYFILLVTSLVLIRMYVYGPSIFYYIVFCVGMINYNLVVDHFPKAKNFYVVAVAVLPILIAIDSSNLKPLYYCVAFSLALFMMGRELLMDVCDSEGDSDSLAINLGLRRVTILAFAIQYISIAVLIPLSTSNDLKLGMLAAMIGISAVFTVLWRIPKWQHSSIMLMKVQMLLGLVFLV